ncbi:hypothetical protein LSAT2_005934 [Lamellibrachia satsuma]|nr:hypothetical protein LSAT2_005934 [Lamellibrachia satsuma]
MKTSFTLVSTKILLLLTVVAVAHCYRNGVRAQSCVDMKPGHGTAQNTTSPYVLEVKGGATTYSAGKEVRVCINNRTFEGLLLQARRADGSSPSPVGRFSTELPDGTKALKCREDADSVTHSNDVDKPAGTCFHWEGPTTESGQIYFIATINEGKNTYWMNVTSKSLAPEGYSNGTTAPPGYSNGTTAPPGNSSGTTAHPGGIAVLLIFLGAWLMYTGHESDM